MAISPVVSVIVPVAVMATVSPLAAAAICARSEPAPESAVVVTLSVAAWRRREGQEQREELREFHTGMV